MAKSYKYRIQCQPTNHPGIDRWLVVFVGKPDEKEIRALRGAWTTVSSVREADEVAYELQEWSRKHCLRGEADKVKARLGKMRGMHE